MIPAGLKVRQLPPSRRVAAAMPETGEETMPLAEQDPTRLQFVASELLATLQYLKREWERDGRIDAINMRHVDEALRLATTERWPGAVSLPMAAE